MISDHPRFEFNLRFKFNFKIYLHDDRVLQLAEAEEVSVEWKLAVGAVMAGGLDSTAPGRRHPT